MNSNANYIDLHPQSEKKIPKGEIWYVTPLPHCGDSLRCAGIINSCCMLGHDYQITHSLYYHLGIFQSPIFSGSRLSRLSPLLPTVAGSMATASAPPHLPSLTPAPDIASRGEGPRGWETYLGTSFMHVSVTGRRGMMGCAGSVHLAEEPRICPEPQCGRKVTCPHVLTESVYKHRLSPVGG